MNLKSILTSKFDFFNFLRIGVIEAVYCLTIYYGYAIFSMLAFGEGASSFMYTVTNGIIFLGLIILPPTIFNLYNLFKGYNSGQFSKSKSYLVTQAVLIIGFIWLLIVVKPVIF